MTVMLPSKRTPSAIEKAKSALEEGINNGSGYISARYG